MSYTPTFDKEKLKEKIGVTAVMDALGIPMQRDKYECITEHKKRKQPTVHIFDDDKSCRCIDCGESRDIFTLVEDYKGMSFLEAGRWLADTFRIYPDPNRTYTPTVSTAHTAPVTREVEYLVFDKDRTPTAIDLRKALEIYDELSDQQRLKVGYTLIYQFTRQPEQLKKKNKYLEEKRGIDPKNIYAQSIGYLDQESLGEMLKTFRGLFGKGTPRQELFEQDLIDNGFLKRELGLPTFKFNYIREGGFLFIPSFDLYTVNEVTGFMLRPTEPTSAMRADGVKELQISNTALVKPLPFGVTNRTLRTHTTLFATEGSMDLCSITGNNEKVTNPGFAIPGTHGLSQEQMGLFRGIKVILAYDQDKAGQKAANGYVTLSVEKSKNKEEFIRNESGMAAYHKRISELGEENLEIETDYQDGMKQKFKKAGVESDVLNWDPAIGGDLNDVRRNGKMSEIFIIGDEGRSPTQENTIAPAKP
ncbi:MAG: toprim domain-containing protein [Epsilonproteobacteria bacterium]|nr:toprim domain-containing protein [Campylobacterota bacterium]